VRTLATSRWYRLPLAPPPEPESAAAAASAAAAREEVTRGAERLTSFPLDGAHYYCETLDVTRPFPSARPVGEPSWEFVWNRWLSTAFRRHGLGAHCPALLQGMFEQRSAGDYDGKLFSYVLVARRCRLHVGPRYLARGLNAAADPGNEIECEQVVWRHAPAGAPLPWSRYTWRRGSVPLNWAVTIRGSGMGEAEIQVRRHGTFRGSRRYVRRLQRRYAPDPELEVGDAPAPAPEEAGAHPNHPGAAAAAAAAAADPSLSVPLVFVSLLRKGAIDRDRSETNLAGAFEYLVGLLSREHHLPLTYIALDWHEMDRRLGTETLIHAFWSTVRDVLPRQGFALGELRKVGPDHADALAPGAPPPGAGPAAPPPPAGRGHSWAGAGWRARWFRQQRGVTRYNCADSLDRTNVGSYFGAIQARERGAPLGGRRPAAGGARCEHQRTHSLPPHRQSFQAAAPGPLPCGRCSTLTAPPPPPPVFDPAAIR